jgi:hypothetical protein
MATVRKAAAKKAGVGTKAVPKKSKAIEKAKAENKTAKITAIEKVKPMEIATLQQVSPEAPAAGLSKSFIKEAQKLDKWIVETIRRVGNDVISLGRAFLEVQTKGYHVALGFKRAEDYIEARWPDQGKTQVFQAMRIVRELTTGDKPSVTEDDIRSMTKENAEGLAKLKKQGHAITPELIQEAKTLPAKQFQDDVVLARSPELAQRAAARKGTHLDTLPEILVKRTVTFTSPVEAMRVKCFEICRWLNPADGARDEESFANMAYSAIFAEFLSSYQAEYEQVMADQESRQLANAQNHSDRDGEMLVVEEVHAAEFADEAAGEEDNPDVANAAEATEDGEEATETTETVAHEAIDGDAENNVVHEGNEDEANSETGDLADNDNDQDGNRWS